MFKVMEEVVVCFGKFVGYVFVGIVEYLYFYVDDKFYFLELNFCFQVEYFMIEMVSGVNFFVVQLQIVMGFLFYWIQDICLLYGVDFKMVIEIDFQFVNFESEKIQCRLMFKGYIMVCCIIFEDFGEGFKLFNGVFYDLNFCFSFNVWGYFFVGFVGGIYSFFDFQFGYIFVYGENCVVFRKYMVVVLKELSICGDFCIIVEYFIKFFEIEVFEDNIIIIGWFDELIFKKFIVERFDFMFVVVCGVVIKVYIVSENCIVEYRVGLEKG